MTTTLATPTPPETAMHIKWPLYLRLRRTLASSGETVHVEAGLRHPQGNRRPYFSVTCWMGDWGGAAHDVIAQLAPELDPVQALHLSDDDGTPMHAVANGWYWLGRTKWQVAKADTLAGHLRVPLAQAEALIARPWRDQAEFGAYVETLRPRWRAEAEAAQGLLRALGAEQKA